MNEYLEKTLNSLFPGYVPGQKYDFSHIKLSEADALRYQQVGDSMEKSLGDTSTVEICNDIYHFN